MTLLEILVRELPKHGGWPDGAVFVAQEEGGELWSFTSKPQKDCDDEWMDESHGGYHTKVGKLREASDHDISTITREQYEAALAAKNDGWIEWGGGECPVAPGTIVDYVMQDGSESERPEEASALRWDFCVKTEPYAIIAYRLHQPQGAAQPKADEEADLNECIGQDAAPGWNGEGLPPVGCECEYLDSNNEWYPVTIKYASNQIVVICGMTNIFGEEQETEIAKDIQLDKPQFRPIRSEADMKRDELAKALHIASGAAPIDLGGIGALYLELADKIISGEIPHLKIV
ncbi:TPA: hypothetical protein ACHSNL_001888 [Klebsiella variicola]